MNYNGGLECILVSCKTLPWVIWVYWRKLPDAITIIKELVGTFIRQSLFYPTVDSYHSNSQTHVLLSQSKPMKVSDLTTCQTTNVDDMPTWGAFNKASCR